MVDVRRRTSGGFARGQLCLAGGGAHSGHSMLIDFQNENLVAYLGPAAAVSETPAAGEDEQAATAASREYLDGATAMEPACDAGYGEGCFNVGIMYRKGIETPKNEAMAQARFRQGCNFGEQKACEALGR